MPKKRKALKPEKIVEADILSTCKQLGLDVSVVDSKMHFTQKGFLQESETEAGFSDITGNTSDGISVYIELKARGKISTLTQKQKKFLIRKAEAGCFAVAVDRAEVLVRLFLDWKKDGRQVLLKFLEQI